jgi:tetratricopeptide (TPR) repeat protein
MMLGLRILITAALMLPSFAVAAFAQGGLVNPLKGAADGTITVYIRDEWGAPVTVTPQIRLTVSGVGTTAPSPAQRTGDGWVFSDLGPGQEYQVEVKADGYQTAYERTTLPPLDHASSDVLVFLKPLVQKSSPISPGGQYILAPRAEKEVQRGLKDLRSRKFASAQKHLERALQMAPGNPYVNYVMGMIDLVSKQVAQAKPYLEKSVSIDPKQPPSLLALGTVRLQLNDYGGAIQVLEHDVQLDPTSWKAEWMLADAYLKQRNYEKAQEYAERALETGKQFAARVALLLGQAQAGLGERDEAANTFEDYLKLHPDDPDAAKIRSFADALKKPAAPTPVPVSARADAPRANSNNIPSSMPSGPVSVSASATPVDLPPRENWAPPDIDAAKPFIIFGAACSLPKILHEVGNTAEQFVTSLEQFSAVEDYQSVEIKRNEQLESPEMRRYSYLVTVEAPRPHVIELHEIRNGSSGRRDMPGILVDTGAPALALAFHPVYRDDFVWTCEGLGEWKDKTTWVVHFEQRKDRPTSLLAAYETPSQQYALPLKGRAWITQNGGHVVHLETDLVHPMAEIGLTRQHFSIDYEPVSFKTHNVQLWLPEDVDVYYQYQGRYIHNYHHYSDFKLFWVETSQKIGGPKQTDRQP